MEIIEEALKAYGLENRKQKVIIIVCICVLILLSGCSEKKTTYTYDNKKEITGLTLTKSVYSDGKLQLYMPDLKENFDLTCYDADLQKMDEDFSTDYKNGIYTIEGEAAERVSGIVLRGSYDHFYIRYLDSPQYAILWEHEATDIGWVTDGDKEKYYTQDELDQQEAAAQKKIQEQEQIFSQFEGIWICTEDESNYLEFYLDENGHRKLAWNHSDGQGGYSKEEINVDAINIIDGLFGPELDILDGIGWGCQYRFDLSEDMTMIINRGLDREEFYLKENNVSEELSVNKDFFMKSMSLDENRALGAAYVMKKIGAGTIVDATNKMDGDRTYTITLISDSGDEYTVTFSEDGFIGTIKDKDDELIYYGID